LQSAWDGPKPAEDHHIDGTVRRAFPIVTRAHSVTPRHRVCRDCAPSATMFECAPAEEHPLEAI
jgi:hypothetical protein